MLETRNLLETRTSRTFTDHTNASPTRSVAAPAERGSRLSHASSCGWYFAYGSNLNVEQMTWRCPSAVPAGRLTLPNWHLVFRGVADIVPCPGAQVEGAVYAIQPSDELALDRYEGFRPHAPESGLYRKEYRAFRDGLGQRRQMMFYVMNDGEISPPGEWYLDTILTGYRDWRMPTVTLEDAVERAWQQGPTEDGDEDGGWHE